VSRVAVLGVLAVGALAVIRGSGPGAGAGELPPVSAPPPAVEEAASAPEGPERILEELRWRHTGLAPAELRRVADTIWSASRRHGLDPELVLAVLLVESGGYNFAVSSVGAMGLMQLMPPTGEELARRHGLPWHGPETLFDPVTNVTLGVAYLKQLSDRFGSWSTALAAYNWGPGRIDRRLRRGAALPVIYVEQVMRFYDASPERLGS